MAEGGDIEDAAYLDEAVGKVLVGIGGGDVRGGVVVNQDGTDGVLEYRHPEYLHFRVQLFPIFGWVLCNSSTIDITARMFVVGRRVLPIVVSQKFTGNFCHPWRLGPGIPCRDDGSAEFLQIA